MLNRNSSETSVIHKNKIRINIDFKKRDILLFTNLQMNYFFSQEEANENDDNDDDDSSSNSSDDADGVDDDDIDEDGNDEDESGASTSSDDNDYSDSSDSGSSHNEYALGHDVQVTYFNSLKRILLFHFSILKSSLMNGNVVAEWRCKF